MATNHVSRKLRTYQSLAHINRHFAAIAHHVKTLEEAGFMPVPKMRVFQNFIRELQSQISHDVCDNMHSVEDKDMFELGKKRIAREHYLNPERPAFMQHGPKNQETEASSQEQQMIARDREPGKSA